MLYYTQTLVRGDPMNKKTIIFWFIYAAILIFLYILSGTDLIIKENEAKVYSVSILMDGISGENLENVKKGMDEAAYEYNVDMSFPAIADNITMEEKLELVKEEIEAGAKAIIIGNRWKREIAEEIRKNHPEIPVLIVGSAEDEKGKASVSLNYSSIVKLLSENIRANEGLNNEICIIAEDFLNVESLAKELKLKLESIGYKLNLVEGEGPKLEKQLKAFDKNRTVFITLDKESAVRLVKYKDDNNLHNKIYAVGTTDYLLGKLEDGEISGMVAWNEYDMGYFMVDKLLKMLTDKSGYNNDEIEVFYITAGDLKNEDYIKKLYPING
jgi:hypothetical protein